MIATCSLKLEKYLKTRIRNHEQTLHEKRPPIEFQKYHCRSEGKQIRDSSSTKDNVSFQLSSAISKKIRGRLLAKHCSEYLAPDTSLEKQRLQKKEYSQISSSETQADKLSRKKVL